MKRALADYGGRVEDELPAYLRERDGLYPKARALKAIHFPETLTELRSPSARSSTRSSSTWRPGGAPRFGTTGGVKRPGVGDAAGEPAVSARAAAPAVSGGLSPLQARLAERLPSA
jgi:hypothetical protein